MKTLQTPARRRGGFSLAELMVVVLIIGLLATVVVPNVIKNIFTANEAKVKVDLEGIAESIEQYRIQNNTRFPDSLERLIEPDKNGFRFLDRETLPKDPWGNEYHYEAPISSSQPYVLLSYGDDGVPGGEGSAQDISWRMVKNQEI